MKSNLKVLLAFIAVAFIGSMAVMAYDIGSYNDRGLSGTWIDKMALTVGEEAVFFNLKFSQQLTLTDQYSFQAQIPIYLEAGPLADATCQITIKSGDVERVIPGTPVTPVWALTLGPHRLIQCRIATIPTGVSSVISTTDQVQITYTGVAWSALGRLLPECAASPFDLLPLPELPLPPFNWVGPLANLDARACCSDAFLQLFRATRVLDRAFPDFCSLATVPDDACGEDCPGSNTRLTSVAVEAQSHLTATRTDLTIGFRTALPLDALSPELPFTSNGEEIPGYIWVRLPRYRASLDNIVGLGGLTGQIQPEDLGITCTIAHTTLSGRSFRHPHTTYISSPQILVRPINSNDQSEGVIVQCALGMDIPAGSRVAVSIKGLYAPPHADSCSRFGATSHSVSCCSGYMVEYRHGNALPSPLIAMSLSTSQCPNFFYDEASYLVASTRIVDRLRFEPTAVAVDDVVETAHFSFLVDNLPTGFSQQAPSFHFSVQGFTLANGEYDTLVASTLPGWENYRTYPNPLTIATAVDSFQANQVLVRTTLNGGFEFVLLGLIELLPGQYATVFFPPIVATTALPNLATCRGGYSGVPSRDATCCNGFRLEIKLGGVSTFTYSEQCPVLDSQDETQPVVYTTAVCNSDTGFTTAGCCFQPESFILNLNPAAQARCLELRCSDSTSNIFSKELCCSNQRYSGNAACCLGGWFCPNFCCHNPIPSFVDDLTGETVPATIGFFNEEMCCLLKEGVTEATQDSDFQFSFDNSNQFKTCSCYGHLNNREWEQFAELQCCDVDLAYVPVGGVAPLPNICACGELYEDLAPVIPPGGTDPEPLSIGEQNDIIREWMLEYPSLTPAYCCAWEELIQSQTPPVVLFEDAANLEPWCDCNAQVGAFPEDVADTCCLYTAFNTNPGCQVTAPPPVPTPCPPIEPCDCPAQETCTNTCEAQGCVNKRKQVVEISDLSSGADTIVNIMGEEL